MSEQTKTQICKTCKYYAWVGKREVCCRDEVKILFYPEKDRAAYYMTKANSHCDSWKAKDAK